MATIVLTDVAHDLWVERFLLTPAALNFPESPAWSVMKRTLQGGRRAGVDLIELDTGALRLAVVPTRGMNLWRGEYRGERLGWDSPVRDGPVNPAFVPLPGPGGLGWLDGFDELLARCGLEHNGAPYAVAAPQADGFARPVIHPLHGRISNLPADYVALHVDDQAPYAITIEGAVTETRLFGPRIRMVSRLTAVPGSPSFTVRDEFTNLGDRPTGLQILYHWNLGPPILEAGARVRVPAKTVVPRDAMASEAIEHYDTYRGPEPGFSEQVYFFELIDGPDGRTVTLLHNRAGRRGVALRFATAQLPCFTLWKSTMGLKEGYVTGLEPATNYPNPKPFEEARGRVVQLQPGKPYVAETVFEALGSADAVAKVEAEIDALQRRATPRILPGAAEPFAPEE